jgi:hypothetical protein
MDSWLAFALCGKENQYLLTQTSDGFENFSAATNFRIILPAALATLSLKVTPEIEHLMNLASLDSEDRGKGENPNPYYI